MNKKTKVFSRIESKVEWLLKLNKDYLLYIFKILITLFLTACTLLAFVELVDELQDEELENFDNTVSAFIYQFRSDALTDFFLFITDFADRNAFLIGLPLIAILLFIIWRNWSLTLQTAIVLTIAGLVNRVLKNYLSRARPSGDQLIEVSNQSFPSGHAMSAIAFYGFLIYIIWVLVKNKVLRISLTLLLTVFIFAIGISRVYLGVHYPSDIVAGYAGGMFWLTLCIAIFTLIQFIRAYKKGKNMEQMEEEKI